jgi:flagellar biosynthesis GTPase FlhF
MPDRRHPDVPTHLGRDQPPVPNPFPNPLSQALDAPALLDFFGGPIPDMELWPIKLKVVGMKVLAMWLLGKGYGEFGCLQRIDYQEKAFQAAYGDPLQREGLHPAFKSMDPYDSDLAYLTIAAQYRGNDLFKEPLWPIVWKTVWDDLFRIQADAQREIDMQVAQSRQDKARARRLRKLDQNQRKRDQQQAAASARAAAAEEERAELVRRHDEREAAEAARSKQAEDQRRQRIAAERAAQAEAAAPTQKNLPKLAPSKRSKRTTEIEASRQRMQDQNAQKARIEAQRAAEAFERERLANVGHAIQYGR